jgi:hypothetical protein
MSQAEVLAAALDYALEVDPKSHLYDVMFGQCAAEGAGYWWRLQFLTDAGSNEHGYPQDRKTRIVKITRKWAEDMFPAEPKTVESEATQHAH